MYTSVASMLIESALPYTAVGIMFLVPYALGSGTAIGFGQVWAKLTVRSHLSNPTLNEDLIEFLVYRSSAHCAPGRHWSGLAERHCYSGPEWSHLQTQARAHRRDRARDTDLHTRRYHSGSWCWFRQWGKMGQYQKLLSIRLKVSAIVYPFNSPLLLSGLT